MGYTDRTGVKLTAQPERASAVRLASAPGSWGIEPPAQAGYPSWTRVLNEMAAAGYDGTELGPPGYLPSGQELREALASRRLQMPAGFLMEQLSSAAQLDRILGVAQETCATLSAAGAQTLILIDGLDPSRSATAGRSGDAARLAGQEWEQLVDVSQAVCEVAGEHGLQVAFHPHAGTHVEFEDEIDRIMDELTAENAGICIDTGHSVYADVDPVALLRRYASRLVHVHLKDVDTEVLERCRREMLSFEQSVAAGVFTPLGAGSIDLAAFVSALHEIGYEGWATFEQDRVVDTIDDALPDARASLEHVRSLGL